MVTPAPLIEAEAEPFIPYVEEPNYPPTVLAVLEPYRRRMGFVPNALKLYMHRPEIAQCVWRLNSLIMRDASSTLDQFLKRRLAVVCSAINGCAYCTAHSCSMLKKPIGGEAEGWGMNEEELQGLLAGRWDGKNEMEKACFDYARAASSDPTAVPSEILNRLRQHLSPPQIIELACVVGFWKFYNTVHDSLHIPVEAALLADTGYVALVAADAS